MIYLHTNRVVVIQTFSAFIYAKLLYCLPLCFQGLIRHFRPVMESRIAERQQQQARA